MSEDPHRAPMPEHPMFAAIDRLNSEDPDMSLEERIPRLNAIAQEYRERVAREGKWDPSDKVEGAWAFEPDIPREELDRILGYLNAVYAPGQRGPWTRFTCAATGRQHDTGAQAQLVRDLGGEWRVEPRRNGSSTKRTPIFGAWNGYLAEDGSRVRVDSPERLELTCAECGHTLYRRPSALAVPMFRELVKHRERRQRGEYYQPRVPWTRT